MKYYNNISNIISNLRHKILKQKILIENFIYLSALQVSVLLLSLISVTYLVKTLGKELYGLVVFAQAIIGYLVIFVGYGFNISATKEISIHRNDKNKISEIVSSVLVIKSILMIIAFFILSIILRYLNKTYGYELLFYLTMWACLYEVIFPIWYFQGIEQMKYITYIVLISRIIFTIMIFIVIRSPSDYIYIPIINGAGALFAGIIALKIIYGKHQIIFIRPTTNALKYHFSSAIPFFISNISANISAATNKVIAGIYLGMQEVAYYDLAEKLTTLLKAPQVTFSQSLFPKVSKEKEPGFVKRVFILSLSINIIIFILFYIYSKNIIIKLWGEQMLPARIAAIIMAFTVPIYSISNILGVQLLVPFGYNKAYSRVIISSFICYFAQISILWKIYGFSIIGLSLIIANTEIFAAIFMFYYCKKYYLWDVKYYIASK
jgi:O-antigen/teichoic acid export membrane protein